jgi:hypothetical protein
MASRRRVTLAYVGLAMSDGLAVSGALAYVDLAMSGGLA